MYKKAKVIMIGTEPESFNDNVPIIKYKDGKLKCLNISFTNNDWIGQHLYILSEEIGNVDNLEPGEWLIDPNGRPDIFGFDWQAVYSKEEILKCRKIIATTNRSLFKWLPYGEQEYLPKPSDSFIKKYVKEYNEGNQITDIMIEYWDLDNYSSAPIGQTVHDLKVASDNTINIKDSKDSWNRDEVIELLDKVFDLGHDWGCESLGGKIKDLISYDKFIEENL